MWSREELMATAVQIVLFLVGTVISLGGGMLIARVSVGPGLLLIATVLAAAGLLGSAALSQLVREHLLTRWVDRR